MAKVLIVIPTFNECENIRQLVDSIFALKAELDVLVVDDNSPDHTGDVVRSLQQTYGEDRLHLIVRKSGKAGRGSACIEGFKFARDSGYSTTIEMDADLSHDPRDIARLLQELREGADVVVASKYLAESRMIGWPLKRRLLSMAANRYVRLMLRLPISDCTNGFRCYGPRALKLLPDFPIDGSGFTVIPQTTYLLARSGMHIVEIPSVCTNRRYGTSNLGLHEIIESFFGILSIRSRSLHRHTLQLCKFFVTGILNASFDLLLFALFVQVFHLPILAASILVTTIVLVNVFLMHKHWTFGNKEKKHASQGIKFALVYSASFILVNAITWVLAVPLKVWYILARLIAIATCAIWNYLWMHFHVFEAQIKPGASRVTDPHAL